MLNLVLSTGLIRPVDLSGEASLRVFAVVAAGALGLLIGSFLNVVVARVPEGRSVVSPGSACPHCGTPIAARDNIPVLSWLLLRGRSRCCDTPIAGRYPVVELATSGAFGLVVAFGRPGWMIPALLYLAAISLALTVIDLDHRRLPNLIVLPAYPVAAVLLSVAALATGEPHRLLRAAICALGSYVFFFALWLIYSAGMGLGDVKLAGVLGLYLGWYGYGQAVIGLFGGFLFGGVLSIGLMAARLATRKSMIPFGPFMLLGAWFGLAFGGPLAHWYLGSM